MSTEISLEDHIDSVMKFEPMCEYNNPAGPAGDCGKKNPAVYLVIYRDPMPCGCTPKFPDRYYCERCWEGRCSGREVCHTPCGSLASPMDSIARITRIKP